MAAGVDAGTGVATGVGLGSGWWLVAGGGRVGRRRWETWELYGLKVYMKDGSDLLQITLKA